MAGRTKKKKKKRQKQKGGGGGGGGGESLWRSSSRLLKFHTARGFRIRAKNTNAFFIGVLGERVALFFAPVGCQRLQNHIVRKPRNSGKGCGRTACRQKAGRRVEKGPGARRRWGAGTLTESAGTGARWGWNCKECLESAEKPTATG